MSTRTTLDTLTEFVCTEREQYSLEDNNHLGTAFSHLMRYYRFLLIILDRYQQASEGFMENTRAMQSLAKPGTHPTTPEQDRLHEEAVELTTRLHLEIESFYLFAKILLDKVAHFVEFYFGQGRGCSLVSHDQFVKSLTSYAAVKEIKLTERFIETMKTLKKDISDHRDYQIAHEMNPRTMHGTLFDAEGKTKIFSNRLYPTERDKQVATQELDKLLRNVDDYLFQFTELIAANRTKTKLHLAAEVN